MSPQLNLLMLRRLPVHCFFRRMTCAGSRRLATQSHHANEASETPVSLRANQIDVNAARPGKLRLDAFVSSNLANVSRAKVQLAIKSGLVIVNGASQAKPGYQIKPGDLVIVESLPEPPPIQAQPESIPLDIVYEDDQLLVVNKAAGMVVHLSAGHYSGTLVNALLHHWGSSAVLSDIDAEVSDDEGEDEDLLTPPIWPLSSSVESRIRPGIVHRIDKGTTGLLVVAKNEYAHAFLSEQFKAKSVGREYFSITIGCPAQPSGTIATNIDRDPNNRKRMAALALGGARGRRATSNYQIKELLADGGAAVVSWR